jgi:hypothetical protein
MGRAVFARFWVAGALAASFLALAVLPAIAEFDALWHRVHWGERSDELAREFGDAAIHLSPPIEFGDSYVDVALRGEKLGGYPFAVYFQMDKKTHSLKRIQFERQRHGVNPPVFRAVMAELERDYGAPDKSCNIAAREPNGFQAGSERLWTRDGVLIRAALRDTTLEASEGCLFGDSSTIGACGATGQLFIQVSEASASAANCR